MTMLQQLNERIQQELAWINYGAADWTTKVAQEEHVYDVIVIGGGQSGLAAAFALKKERISNIVVLDENPEGFEGPWETYARMVTLRTPKTITSVDLGHASLTYQAWHVAKFGENSWNALDKIPRSLWMQYLRWYREVLQLPVENNMKVDVIQPLENSLHRVHVEGGQSLLARKVVLATGIQGGGEWHVPQLFKDSLSRDVYAHTSELIDFAQLKGKRVAIIGGGASAFDNAYYALQHGVKQAHVFVRREQMPRVNPIRQMEHSGLIERFHALSDDEKYVAIAHFFSYNQPPTNDTFRRAASFSGFALHTGSPIEAVVQTARDEVQITTPKGTFTYDFVVISTGLLTNPALRRELRLVEPHIARWSDCYDAPNDKKHPLIELHPYLGKGFEFTSRTAEGQQQLHGLFSFNYGALPSCGLVASALSGMRFGIPRLVSAIADQLFLDERQRVLDDFLAYNEEEFTADEELAAL